MSLVIAVLVMEGQVTDILGGSVDEVCHHAATADLRRHVISRHHGDFKTLV